jgi:uncharacterized protein YecE (DUF72 family)
MTAMSTAAMMHGVADLGTILQVSRHTRVLVGTCSWTDKTLTDDTDWYPRRSMTAEERLRFYAGQFPIVEADSTYYFPPSRQLTRSWVERTPADFVMNVKAYSLLTGHPTRPASLWRDLRDELPADVAAKRNLYPHHLDDDALEEVWLRFVDALVPLVDAGKLGAVLMQYPTWFVPKHDNRDELARMRERMEGLPVCVELRSPTWFAARDRDRTLDLLRELELSLVVVDAPKASKLPTLLEVTNDALAVVRFHGRADDTWNARTGSAAERFRYLYSKQQLRPWAKKLESLGTHAREVHALMNNCYRDHGVRNAAELRAMLG